MTKGSRLAACAAALCLAACAPRHNDLGGDADAAADAQVTSADATRDAPAAVDLGAPCVLGGTSAVLPTTIGCTQAPPRRIVVSGDHVYWTMDGAGPTVMRAALAGGAAEALVYDNVGALGLAVDPTFVYYTQPALGRIVRVPIAGGAPTVLATKLDSPELLATDGASLYCTGGKLDGRVMKLDLTPTARPVTLIDGQSAPFAIAVADGYVYWTDISDGTVLRTLDHLSGPADAAVRTANRLADGLTLPTDLALAGGYVYVVDQAKVGLVRRVPLDGGDLQIVSEAHGAPFGLATDGRSIAWSTSGAGGAIFTAPLGAGVAAVTVVDAQADPRFLAVTTDQVYWETEGGHPAVHRLARAPGL